MEPDSSDEDDPEGVVEPVEPVTRCQAEAILKFYHTYERAPTRRRSGHGATVPEEPSLAVGLYYLRKTAAQNKVTESIRLLREGAPELLEPVKTMEQKAADCVTILKPNPPAAKVPQWCRRFIQNRRREVKDKKRSLEDKVCQILTRGLPDWLANKRAKRGAPAGGQQPSPQPALKHPRLQADSSPPTPFESAISPLPPSVPAPGPLLPPPASQAPCRSHEPAFEHSSPSGAPWHFRGLMQAVAMCATPQPARLADPAPSSAPAASSQSQGSTAATTATDTAQQTEADGPPELQLLGDNEIHMSPSQMALLREMALVDPKDKTVFVAGLASARRGDTEPPVYRGSAYGTTCTVLKGRYPFRELEVVGLSSEIGGRTYSYYSAALWFLKAVWHVLTGEDGPFKFEQRLDPFCPDQHVFIFLGASTVVKMGCSGTAAAFLALLARFTTCRMRRDTAVSGILSLSGQILAVEHVNVKLAGAKKAGMTRVVLPLSNKGDVEERFKQDPDMKVAFADDVVDLLHLCLENGADYDPKNPELIQKLVEHVGLAHYVCDDGKKAFVECCAFPGTGRIRITGLELDREVEIVSAEGKYFNLCPDAMHATALAGLVWLFSVEEDEWFQELRQGYRRFSLSKLAILIEDEKDGKLTEIKADLHIHFPYPCAGGNAGMPTVLALAELMLGYTLGLRLASKGCVTGQGHVWLSHPMHEVKNREFQIILTSKQPGEDGLALPKAPAGVEVRGVTHMKEALEMLYSYEEENKGLEPGVAAEEAGQMSHGGSN